MLNQYYPIRSYRCRLIYNPIQLLIFVHPDCIRPQPTLKNKVVTLSIKLHLLTLANCHIERRSQLHSFTHILSHLIDAGIILEALVLSLHRNSRPPLIFNSTFQDALNDAFVIFVFGVGVFDGMKAYCPFSRNVLH